MVDRTDVFDNRQIIHEAVGFEKSVLAKWVYT